MSSVLSSLPRVYLVTARGRFLLNNEGDERLVNLLNRHNLPWSALSVYTVAQPGSAPVLFSCLDLQLSEMEGITEILLYYNRNINPLLFSFDGFDVINSETPGSHSTEYFYQFLDNKRSKAELFLKKLSSDECKSIIADRVADTVREYLPYGAKIVVGISGGGDSNAMLHGLTQLQNHGISVHPIIIKGIPEWDLGVARAQQLCDNYGLNLKIMEEAEVKQVMGVPTNTPKLSTLFEDEFTGDDFEFLGTLLVRMALTKYAKDLGAAFICTGLNLEDVLCEEIYRTSAGLKPAGIPTRVIGDVTLLFPLWLCPKRIIDGCFPKFSLENYEARYPCFSLGRNLYYSVVYSMQSRFPGFVEQLVKGYSAISTKDPVKYIFDEQMGFYMERAASPELRARFMKMLGRTQPTGETAG
jgi:tRNA(Ile)-lysidine synthase TilS/MesJ